MGRGRPKKQEEVEYVGHPEPQIIVQSRREKRRAEPPLSSRRIIKDSYRKREEEVHFNMGFMPGNSWRCQSCRNGFALLQGTELKCPNCGSKDLKPHSSDIIR